MKKIYSLLLILFPALVFSQQDSIANNTSKSKKEKKEDRSLGLGIKAGLNFTNITSAAEINNTSETGFQVGIFLDPSSRKILGSRTELVYSSQAYNYSTGLTTGNVKLNYVMLSQLMAINITRFFQIQLGGQIAYLLNAQADNSKMTTGIASIDNALSYYNRIDAGFGFGLEVRPFKGILVGARYNISMTNLYKMPDTSMIQDNPNYVPSGSGLNFKNNLLQFYIGYRF
ncbi:porin family protein [Flavihumibacter profundi]|uniref:porin family protein n=1 Tax=Flavihumibacter profundi TaxID=2716883 RepID=UPI001CC80317|nr:porin family protein [Flavihumibacter profundi]MBZ5857704.1 PorT family protein [Flavihumibacter profundi]